MHNNKLESDDLNEALVSIIKKDYVPNLQLPDPDLIDIYKDLNDRVIWLNDTIDDDSLNVIKLIMKYNKEDKGIEIENRKPIRLFIDTNGGSVSVMTSIISAIKISKTPIWTINFCDALSAGALILAAGHKRFGMPGSTVLIHSGSCAYSGTKEQAESANKYYQSLTSQADEQLFKNTKIDKKTYNKKAPYDWYLNTDDALKYGVIDKVIDDLDEILL